jgi:hypothetical protein
VESAANSGALRINDSVAKQSGDGGIYGIATLL